MGFMEASLQEAINDRPYQTWKLIKKPSPLGSWATVLGLSAEDQVKANGGFAESSFRKTAASGISPLRSSASADSVCDRRGTSRFRPVPGAVHPRRSSRGTIRLAAAGRAVDRGRLGMLSPIPEASKRRA